MREELASDSQPALPMTNTPSLPPQPFKVHLFDRMSETFNLEGIKNLCFRLGFNYDSLSGDQLDSKIRELILEMERKGRLPDLLAFCTHLYPHVAWPSLPTSQPTPLEPAPSPVQPNQRNPRQIFLSHASHDGEFAQQLASDLRRHGWVVWMAPDSIRPGEHWVAAINRGLAESGVFLLLQTPAAVESDWVQHETNVAIGLHNRRVMRFISLEVQPAEVPPLWDAFHWISFRLSYATGLKELLHELETPAVKARVVRPAVAQVAQLPQRLPPVEEIENHSDEFEHFHSSREEPDGDLETASRSVSVNEFLNFWLGMKLSVFVLVCVLIFGGSLIAQWIRSNGEDIDSHRPPPNAQRGDEWVRPKDGMVMVFVPAGTFMMGSTAQEIDDAFALCVQIRGSSNCSRSFYEDEEYREVTLEGFWIDKYEVSNAQYQRCVDDGACPPSSLANDSTYNGVNYPVVGVSWHNAVAYAAWVGAELPTEEQWEYAARGKDRLIYPWGNEFDGTWLNCDFSTSCPKDGYQYTAPVKSYVERPSWVGALNMVGNVWEWTRSPYNSITFVLRGGSWGSSQNDVRASYRISHYPDFRHNDFGFRLVSPISLGSEP